MTTLQIVRHADYDADLPAGHRFPMGKFAALAQILREEGMATHGFSTPSPATRAQLIAAHDEAYVDAVLSQRVAPDVERRIGLPITQSVAARAVAAVGGTLLTARLALQHGVACNTAGGSHHAFRDTGAGFCVFNDVAVAASVLLAEGAIGSALVIDCDVHQGDGTALIFADDPRVFTLSIHCAQNFPSRKQTSDLDVALDRGADGSTYLAALSQALDQAFARTRPDLVFYNAGVDVHGDDALGLFVLTDNDIAARERFVLQECFRRRGLPVCGVLGGGYGPDVHVIADRHAHLHRAAAAVLA